MTNYKKAYCPNCFYLEVNIEDNQPFYCSLWGLKTIRTHHPSREIFLATGKECPYYYKQPLQKKEPKKSAKKKESGLDFLV